MYDDTGWYLVSISWYCCVLGGTWSAKGLYACIYWKTWRFGQVLPTPDIQTTEYRATQLVYSISLSWVTQFDISDLWQADIPNACVISLIWVQSSMMRGPAKMRTKMIASERTRRVSRILIRVSSLHFLPNDKPSAVSPTFREPDHHHHHLGGNQLLSWWPEQSTLSTYCLHWPSWQDDISRTAQKRSCWISPHLVESLLTKNKR